MEKLVQVLDGLLRPIERTVALLAGAFVLVMMLVVTVEVVGRGVFNHPFRGNLDIVEQLMVLLVSLGIAYGQSHFGNVRMTLIVNRLGGRRKWIGEAFALMIAGFVVWVLTKGAYAHFLRAWRNGGDTPELGIPLWIGILVVTASLGLLFVRIAVQFLDALRLIATPNAPSRIFRHVVAAQPQTEK